MHEKFTKKGFDIRPEMHVILRVCMGITYYASICVCMHACMNRLHVYHYLYMHIRCICRVHRLLVY